MKLSRRQKYYIKQKALGLLMVIIGILFIIFCGDRELAGTMCIITIPIGTVFMLTDDMFIMNDYYWYVQDKKLNRRGRHS